MNESKMEESSTLFTNREPFYSFFFFFLNNSERKCIQVVHNQFNPVYSLRSKQKKRSHKSKKTRLFPSSAYDSLALGRDSRFAIISRLKYNKLRGERIRYVYLFLDKPSSKFFCYYSTLLQ
jgi:hypothetical protein